MVCFLFFGIPNSLGNPCLEKIMDRQLGVKEAGGNNRGWKIAQYLESVGLPEGYPWCASYVHWVLEKCSIPNTITAWSPTAHNKKNIVYFRREFKKHPKVGDVFTIYSMRNGRISHTGFFRERINDKFYLTNEGNASAENAANPYDGNGVYEKVRSFNATYSITRWE